jgi:FkbM family methyltransferase
MIDRALVALGVPHVATLRHPAAGRLRFWVHGRTEQFRVRGYGAEREVWERFLALLRPADVVFDVGASLGLYAVAAARLCRAVYAFEPDPAILARLRANIALNRLANLHAVPWAAGDRPATLTLYSDGADGFAPSLAAHGGPGAPRGVVPVQARPLDEAVAAGELPPPDVLKLDVEGAEALALRGAARILAGELGPPPRALLVEIHPAMLAALGDDEAAVRGDLAAAGYTLAWEEARAAQAIGLYTRG